MANVDQLTAAGLIPNAAALTPEDHQVINSLTPEEVSALISVKSKLTPGFTQRHLSAQSSGIVF
jgi:hypothetical protein